MFNNESKSWPIASTPIDIFFYDLPCSQKRTLHCKLWKSCNGKAIIHNEPDYPIQDKCFHEDRGLEYFNCQFCSDITLNNFSLMLMTPWVTGRRCYCSEAWQDKKEDKEPVALAFLSPEQSVECGKLGSFQDRLEYVIEHCEPEDITGFGKQTVYDKIDSMSQNIRDTFKSKIAIITGGINEM